MRGSSTTRPLSQTPRWIICRAIQDTPDVAMMPDPSDVVPIVKGLLTALLLPPLVLVLTGHGGAWTLATQPVQRLAAGQEEIA